MLYTPVCLATLHIFLSTGFIFENHNKPTPYTIGTKHSPKMATSKTFVKIAGIFLQIRYMDKPSLTNNNNNNNGYF